MRKILGLLGVTLLFLSAPAVAADLPLAVPVKAPPAPAYNWTGFYVGGNVGGVIGRESGTSDFLDPGSFDPAFFSLSNPQNNSFSRGGVLAGAQAGYYWQFSSWGVVGFEGDWDWGRSEYSFCRQTDTASTPCDAARVGTEAIGSKLNWLATARERAGVLVAPWLLVYGTGGLAFGSVTTTLSQDCPDGCGVSQAKGIFASSATANTRMGWVAGVGIEAMLGEHWLLREEWLHVDLGTFSNALSTIGGFANGGPQVQTTETTTWSRSAKFDEIRAALSYKF